MYWKQGANDVYVVALPNGKELLLPAIKDCILNVDMENGEMTVHILDGLMDAKKGLDAMPTITVLDETTINKIAWPESDRTACFC